MWGPQFGHRYRDGYQYLCQHIQALSHLVKKWNAIPQRYSLEDLKI